MIDKLTINFLKKLSDAIPRDFSDKEMQMWCDNPVFLKEIMKELRGFVPLGVLEICRVNIDYHACIRMMKESKISVYSNADELLQQIHFNNFILGLYNFVIVTPEMLDLTTSITLGAVLKSAIKRGLQLLSPELAVHLRLNYLSQPEGSILVGMEPFKTNVFILEKSELSLNLNVTNLAESTLLSSGNKFVFIKPLKKIQ